MAKVRLKKCVSDKWQAEPLQSKIRILLGIVFTIFAISALFVLFTIKISMLDFRYSLSSNEKVGKIVEALEEENVGFKTYMRGEMTDEEFEEITLKTDSAIEELPMDYGQIGEERFAWSQTINKAYMAYSKSRAQYLGYGRVKSLYIKEAYRLYEMQDYLIQYANNLMTLTNEDLNSFYSQRYPTLVGFIIIIIIFSVGMLIGIAQTSKLLNKTLTEPVVKLVGASKEIAKNNYDIEDIEVDNKDEIGQLVHAFNKMKYATGRYIMTMEANRVALDRLHQEEMQKKEVENQLEKMKLEALRNQINPHFLFNTLNVISGMASLEEAEVTEKMIKALSSLFRYMLRTEEKENSLEHEIQVIKDYMYLQKMRFGERIRFEVDCDETLFDVLVPTFTIQPIVENSIVHGLSKKEEGGLIVITAKEIDEGKNIELVIADTGEGMTETELSDLMEKLENEEVTRRGIGVGNIYRRLRLMYEHGCFDIQSEKGVGTKTIIRIPLKREAD